jgi:FtsH-binding integral membrane protein
MSDVYTFPEDRRPVADLGVSERGLFIARTYGHLFGAIIAFVILEGLFFSTSLPERMIAFLGGGSWRWLIFLGGFMVVGWLASRTAMAATSRASQYLALGAYVVVEALIFVPLLWVADNFAPGAIESAAVITLLGFGGLTAVVFVTRRDFSFLRGILGLAMVVALLIIVGGAIFGLHLGMWFSVAMVAVACGAILYDTSNVLHHYPVEKHVAASLALFASVALLFWYVLLIVIRLQSD